MFQHHGGPPRTETQYASFQRALHETMDLWYAHCGSVVVFLTELPPLCTSVRPYSERGWTFFERSCAELIKPEKVLCMCMRKHVHTRVHVHVHLHVHLHAHCSCAFTCTCNSCACTYICMCVCTHVHAH